MAIDDFTLLTAFVMDRLMNRRPFVDLIIGGHYYLLLLQYQA